MSDRMRWRYENTNPVVAAVCVDDEIEIGDLLWQDRVHARPAHECHSGDTFRDLFLGVAMQRSPKGHPAPIRVATSGVFEFDCSPTTWCLGDPVGVVRRDGPLLNQSVRFVQPDLGVGRVAKYQHTEHLGSVYVAIQSTVMGPLQ